jgi:adenylate cyclase
MIVHKTYTVLVADDDSTTRAVITKILENEGFKVLQADRGEKCLFVALEKDVDAFIIDVHMPGLSGMDVCNRLRSIEKYKLAPVIFITSEIEYELLDDAFKSGGTDFIRKPINQVVLTARLQSHLRKVDHFRELEKIRNYTNSYISPRTRRLVEAYSTTGIKPSPELQDVCIMFTDIRSFTSISEEIPLDAMFDALSSHLGMQVNMVHKHNGYIDKFGGDGLMAIFDGENMATDACNCALDIIDSTSKSKIVAGKYKLPVGIGINYGKVMIGNIGSAEHLDYSAIGETVNLAARLCGYANRLEINISKEIMGFVNSNSDFQVSEPQLINLKGLSNQVPIHQLSRKFHRLSKQNNQ